MNHLVKAYALVSGIAEPDVNIGCLVKLLNMSPIEFANCISLNTVRYTHVYKTMF